MTKIEIADLLYTALSNDAPLEMSLKCYNELRRAVKEGDHKILHPSRPDVVFAEIDDFFISSRDEAFHAPGSMLIIQYFGEYSSLNKKWVIYEDDIKRRDPFY